MTRHEKLLADIRNTDSYKEGNYHQAILDICYDEWEKEENKHWDYEDMLTYAEVMYGSFARFMVQMGKYNQQVTNGGHLQYFDNGYASDDKFGCFHEHNKSCHLHSKLMHLMVNFNLHNDEIGQKVYNIMKRFRTEVDDYVQDYDDPCDAPEHPFDEIDTEYFDIDDKWMKQLNQLVKSTLEGDVIVKVA